MNDALAHYGCRDRLARRLSFVRRTKRAFHPGVSFRPIHMGKGH